MSTFVHMCGWLVFPYKYIKFVAKPIMLMYISMSIFIKGVAAVSNSRFEPRFDDGWPKW